MTESERKKYEVTVPIVPFVRSSFSDRTWSELPNHEASAGNLRVRPRQDHWVAIGEIVADTQHEAMMVVLEQADALVHVLAAGGNAFLIDHSRIRTEAVASVLEQSGTSTRNAKRWGDRIELSGFTELQKTKVHLDFEEQLLESMESWTPALQRALELNYLASTTREPNTQFLLLVTALQVLTWGRLGEPDVLLGVKLESTAYRDFKDGFETLLDRADLDEGDRARLRTRIYTTHAHSVVAHLLTYLQSVNVVRWSGEDIGAWWSIRGKLAHAVSVDGEAAVELLPEVRKATTSALMAELKKVHSETELDERV